MASFSTPAPPPRPINQINTDATAAMKTAMRGKVKNKMPAPIQITAEQIIKEATELSQTLITLPAKRKFIDSSEIDDYLLSKRKQFEDILRLNRDDVKVWIKYANWEAKQGYFDRSRCVWERALDVDHKNPTLWIKYAEFESINKFLNHARNVWDRAVTLLPRVDQVWYKYIHFEEILGNVDAARLIFNRWMNWVPDLEAWFCFIDFELRWNEIDRARDIYERVVDCHSRSSVVWIKYAKFEFKNGEIAKARNVYLRAVEKIVKDVDGCYDDDLEKLFVAFAEFEVLCNEIERARCLYKYAIDHLPKGKTGQLHNKFLAFEKQFGKEVGIEDAIVEKRRVLYENQVRSNAFDYDSWFDYIRLEGSVVGNTDRIREIYERAIANVPPAEEKRYWQRYIYLWINYALFEELVAGDVDRTRAVYKECLKLIPHHKFSFAKLWVLAAQFELRQLNLQSARLILGNAIGRAPKDKLYKKYIELELQLGNIDRCRKLYEKYLEWSPDNCYAWSKYAELETSLCETERARGIFEIAISQPALDMPEVLWKAYIDFEISHGEYDRAQRLYRMLLNRTKHLNVWVSYATFEASAMGKDGADSLEEQKLCIKKARRVFEEAVNYYRVYASELKEERAMLLEEWLNMESNFGELGDATLVQAKLPKKIKRKRAVALEDSVARYEEYVD